MDLLDILLTIGVLFAVAFTVWFVTDVLLGVQNMYGTAGYFMEPLALYLRVRLGLRIRDVSGSDSLRDVGPRDD